MTPEHFSSLYRELMDENPFTLRAVLKLLEPSLTDTVPTLAVTMEDRPRMLVNLAFVQQWCRTEQEVKALICHEFLHVLLRHTEQRGPQGEAEHIAQDAVINSIIHRQLGPRYSSLMSRYYQKAQGVIRLLRCPSVSDTVPSPMTPPATRQLLRAWRDLYDGRLAADDIASLAAGFPGELRAGQDVLLGGHGDDHDPVHGMESPPPELDEALDRILRSINGEGIWRDCASRGVGSAARQYRNWSAPSADLSRWQRATLEVLRKHLLPDARGTRADFQPSAYLLPVLSPSDRRATLRALWSPFLPEASWPTSQPRIRGSAQVYLDASGSMDKEMPLLIGLLKRLSSHIRRPFWAFSTEVAPARIEHGQLVTHSTGGTTFGCVLKHLAQTRPAAAVVITDGHIEKLSPELLTAASGTRLHVILTCGGSPNPLRAAGIGFTQLGALPG